MKNKRKEKKHQEVEVVLGEKIRDVKLNERQHFLLFVAMIIFFNTLMLASVWFVLIYLNMWYNWVICIALLCMTFALSFKVYVNTKTFNKCELYDNAVMINSIWLNYKVEFKDIYEMNVKESILDKIFKINTKSLEIKLMNHRRHKFTIHFIEESAVQLKQEITILIDRYENQRKNNNEKTSD